MFQALTVVVFHLAQSFQVIDVSRNMGFQFDIITYSLSPKLYSMPSRRVASVIESIDSLCAPSSFCYKLICKGMIQLATLHALLVLG